MKNWDDLKLGSTSEILFYSGTLSSLHYSHREDHCCTVTLMSGLPGSGKDTWLTQTAARAAGGLS